MTNAEKREMNRIGLMNEYKNLNAQFDKMPCMEVSARMSDIIWVLLDEYHMSEEEIEALEA